MKEVLNKLTHHQILTKEEAKESILQISKGSYNPTQIASFLTTYMMRSIRIEELEGFREALLELCIPIDLSAYEPIDLCGTGGDHKNTFNISTLASFITAGAGVAVAKHGNYSVSSISGSSNVLESLGVKFSNDEKFLQQCIDETNLCVLHAPLFHPAMKAVASVRKDLAVKTFFNILGPMVNPAFPKKQVVGVFSLELARMYHYLYQKTSKSYTIVHALDAYDEVSLTGDTKIFTPSKENVLTPQDFGYSKINPQEIYGGNSVEKATKLFYTILRGKGTESQNAVVIANSALAIATAKNINLPEALAAAKDSLLSNKALNVLQRIQKISA
ncbi:anthranilate phosphoribosyltransferase [Mesonia ostreae]|uniref:Anthranilate phosphoribosyltransferase n=1 Tax=Mesonia ostreae TaxID=861110 RepID=A0ABU2KES0_9FLAO|nr:anthranilate phosphoribosyltransferase [Mesonia ostreae]MDT0293192.1 anthranilate phosphoribosyltransferase [Mesonia ostreae]